MEAIVGAVARRQILLSPRSGAAGVKRFLGHRADDPEVRRASGHFAHAVASPTGDVALEAAGRAWSPPELLAPTLSALRAQAEAQLEGPVAAVVSVPPTFGHAARQALKDAAALAGLEIVRLLGDGAAVALAIGARRRSKSLMAVCDLGAAQFGVSIVAIEPGTLHVLAAAGDTVGGDDFDRRIAARLAGADSDASDLRAIEDAQRVKHLAVDTGQAPFGDTGEVRTVRRGEIESWTRDLIDRLDEPCREALSAAEVRPTDVREVVLVGGAGRLPAVQRKLEQVFGCPVVRPPRPEDFVALGAAEYTALIGGSAGATLAVESVTRPLSLRGAGGKTSVLIRRGTPLPAATERLVTASHDGQRDVGVDVYEGDAGDPHGRRRLARFMVPNLPPASAGEGHVWLDFAMDADGLVAVAARPLGGTAAVAVKQVQAVGLSRADLRRLIAPQR
jgi:molecular chaperone DnaK (HSP70)